MWTRSANVSNTRNVNNINTSGTANNNNNASNTYALLPDNASTKSREVSPDKKSAPKPQSQCDALGDDDLSDALHRRISAVMKSAPRIRYFYIHGLFKESNMPTSFTLDSLIQAAYQCSKGVKWKTSVASWIHPRNIATNCIQLLDELERGEYHLSPYSIFHITSPKPRTIKAPKFRDRVVQRAACNLGLYDDLTRDNVYDNGACQKGKGTVFTMNRLTCHMQRFWRKHGTDGWVLRLDIRKFFDSIPHDKLKAMVMKKVRNEEFAWIACEVIDSFDDPGIGLGSQLSQLLAISYLSDLDHYIKEELQIKHDIRYSGDDAMFECHDVTADAWDKIRSYLHDEKGLDLNEKKCSLTPLRHGIKFMKFRFFLSDTGKVIRTLDRENVTHARRRLKKLVALCMAGKRTQQDVIASFNSWKAHAELGNSYHTIRRIEQCLMPLPLFRLKKFVASKRRQSMQQPQPLKQENQRNLPS